MTPDQEIPGAPPLAPREMDRLQELDAPSRAEWMLEDCVRYEEAWGLENADGWVLFKLDNAPPGRSPWVLPLWPRQELAALASRSADERPRRIALDELMDSLLPEVGERGWQLLACPHQAEGFAEDAARFGQRLAEAWNELNEEEG